LPHVIHTKKIKCEETLGDSVIILFYSHNLIFVMTAILKNLETSMKVMLF